MEAGGNSSNRRSFFRVRFDNHPALLRVVSVGHRKVDLPPQQGWLEDLSGGGCAIATDLDLPIRLGVKVEVEFEVLAEAFRLPGEILRKVDDRQRYSYGVAFVGLTEAQRSRIIRVLHRLEAEQKRRREEARDSL